jgi:hypothetical protein
MSASDEWTEWHLTPDGWKVGSTKVDFAGVTEQEPPPDRVLTHRWSEHLSSVHSTMDRAGEIIWQSDDQKAVAALLAKFGNPPQKF